MNRKSDPYILAKFDVSGIQSYIFASNRLQENVGASCQVTRILEEFLPDSIKEEIIFPQDYVLDWEKEDRLCILEKENLKAEIVYIGGGNAVVLFRGRQEFEKVSQSLGRKVAENCQGIYLVSAYVEKTELQNFKSDMEELGRNLAGIKADMIRQPVYSPFPVVEQDNMDHQPITRCYKYKKDGSGDKFESYVIKNMTEMRYQKWKTYQWSRHNKDKKMYPMLDKINNYDYPVEMEQLCSKNCENSYIAVVHIDGNGMGRQIQEVLNTETEYAVAVSVLRQKSKEITGIFKNAYRAVLLKLENHTKLLSRDDEERTIFPLRPVILDGDDFTFLCAADLAIPIAAGFLNELSNCQKEENKKITACAGIAFVHSHFPFSEAYHIAEETCSRAKKKWYKERKEKNNCQDSSFLDFCVLKGSEVGGVQKHEEWQMRPYCVTVQNKRVRNDALVYLYDTIKAMEDKWPSNRLHRIYGAMLEGDEQMKLLQKEFLSRKYNIEELIQTDDWRNSSLYDALELRGLCRTELLEDLLNIQEKQVNEKMEFKD
ncbi:MAG: hypothetical protein Q4D16_02945 [Eubacteriales bacterium]|nr:hypothetical protein [Eubacteriales bacterium]